MSSSHTKSGLSAEAFIAEIDNKRTELYTLTNINGCEATVTNYGAKIVSLMVPDRN